jgi:hypothetical protein
VDFLNIHWYGGTNSQEFKDWVAMVKGFIGGEEDLDHGGKLYSLLWDFRLDWDCANERGNSSMVVRSQMQVKINKSNS